MFQLAGITVNCAFIPVKRMYTKQLENMLMHLWINGKLTIGFLWNTYCQTIDTLMLDKKSSRRTDQQ